MENWGDIIAKVKKKKINWEVAKTGAQHGISTPVEFFSGFIILIETLLFRKRHWCFPQKNNKNLKVINLHPLSG